MASRPYVFVGSSTEGLKAAHAIQRNLEYAGEVEIWSQGVFGLGQAYLESLLEAVQRFDFAILVLTPDDLVQSRGELKHSPRDNVLFELGLFLGGLGRKRTFLIHDRSVDLKLPSDLAGIVTAKYTPPQFGSWPSALGTACSQIGEAIEKGGPRAPSHP